MDPPDTSFVRGRELLDPSPNLPIRLQMPSGLYRDPTTDKNSNAHFYVDPASTVAEPPVSLGIHPQEANDRSSGPFPTMAPNVGHSMSHVSGMQMGSEMFHISEVENFSTRNDDSVFPTHFDRTVVDERFDDSVTTQRPIGHYGGTAYGFATDAVVAYWC